MSLSAVLRLQFEAIATILPRTPLQDERSFQIEDVAQVAANINPGRGQNSNQIAMPTIRSLHQMSSLINNDDTSGIIFNAPLLGSMVVKKQPRRHRKDKKSHHSRYPEFQVVALYRFPLWLSCKAWQLCYYRAHMGWKCNLATYNIIPENSRQFRLAREGRFSELQQMIAAGRASIFDQTEDGNTMLSVSALPWV